MEFSIVADESVDFRIVTYLRERGFLIFAICESTPSISDDEVLKIAVGYNALLLTEEKDFGELVFRLQLPHQGILLIRIEEPSSKINKVAEAIISFYPQLIGKFSVIDENRLIIKEL